MKRSLVILALVAAEASAQRVVVLDLHGDHTGHVRKSLEAALSDAGFDVVPNRHKKLKGATAARALKVDVAVGGELHHALALTAWNAGGHEVWWQTVKVHGTSLPPGLFATLAQALKPPEPAKEPEKEPEPAAERRRQRRHEPKAEPEPEPTPEPRGERRHEPKTEPEPEPAASAEEPTPPPAVAAPKPVARPEAKREEAAEEAAAQRADTAPVIPPPPSDDEPRASRVGPKLFSFFIGPSLTWRTYCAVPRVDSCAEYDMLPPPRPTGAIESQSAVPYLGFQITAEAFPLAAFFDNALQGLGLMGGFSFGTTRNSTLTATSNGLTSCNDATNNCVTVSTERTWNAALAYRYYFTQTAYAGVHLGIEGRVFQADPGSNRLYPVIAADGVVPIIRQLNVELSASFFINPHAGPDEAARMGTPSAVGFQLEAGLAGSLFGPLGYRLRLRYSVYDDRFTGKGSAWLEGGVGFESYMSVFAGPTLSF